MEVELANSYLVFTRQTAVIMEVLVEQCSTT